MTLIFGNFPYPPDMSGGMENSQTSIFLHRLVCGNPVIKKFPVRSIKNKKPFVLVFGCLFGFFGCFLFVFVWFGLISRENGNLNWRSTLCLCEFEIGRLNVSLIFCIQNTIPTYLNNIQCWYNTLQLTLITFKKARFQYSNYDIFLKLVLCIFWTFTASIHLHKNEAWIRAYIFCNITFVKSNTFNTLLKIAVPWVNTESLNVTKPIWLQFYITCNQSKVILKISTVPGLVIIEMAWNNRNLIVINAIL